MQSIIINVCNSRKFGFSSLAMAMFYNRNRNSIDTPTSLLSLRQHPIMIDIVRELGGIQSGLFGANLQLVSYPAIAANYMTISDDGYDVNTDTTHHAEYLVFNMVNYKLDAIQNAVNANESMDRIRDILSIADFVAEPVMTVMNGLND